MSTSKVSNYKQWYYNPVQIHIELLESTNSTPNILRDDCNDKLPLITESVVATRIDIQPVGEEPDQHTIHLTPRGSHVWQPFSSPYYVEIGPLLLGWSLGPRPHSPSKNKGTTWSREVRSDIVVTKATQLIGPHKTQHVLSTQLKACHQGQNSAVLNRHGRGLPHRNLRIATSLSPPFPSECSTDPPTCPAWSSNSQ
jgi:hypothetical protein